VPKISEFYGVVIRMYHNDHGPPHFHASYGGREAGVAFDGRLLWGRLPVRAARLVREWARLRSAELLRNWARVRKGATLERIPPLE